MVIYDLRAQEFIYSHQANHYFTPASTLKLYTSYAALSYLGEHYTYQTTLKFDPTKINASGLLNGDVVLSFSGDPSFSYLQLTQLLSVLNHKGVRQINGKILIENHGFTLPYESPGATWDTWSYYPPVASIILNQNKIPVKLQPSTKVNQPCLASIISDNKEHAQIILTHNITTVSSEQAEQSCSLEALVRIDNSIHLSGCWPINQPNFIQNISLASPEKALTKQILILLKSWSIHYPNQKLYFTKNDATKLNTDLIASKNIATISSLPLAQLLKVILGDSDNLYADSLHKKLGETYFGIGSYAYGVKAQHAILAKLAIPIELTHHYDGSGVSRYNLITPNQLVHLLSQIYQDKKNYPAILNALPVAGISGTLKNRFNSPQTSICREQLHAKTGTLKNMSALAGYLTLSPTQHYAFALMIQGDSNKTKALKQKEDILLSEITQILS